jgi:dihydroorotate dehydrogenase
MPDLSIDFAGIKSPNPFWLASARLFTAREARQDWQALAAGA